MKTQSASQFETLETRNLFTVTAGFDTAFAGGTVALGFGGNFAQAMRVGVLKDGRVLATGWANTTRNGPVVPVAALFNADGALSKGFDGDGKVVFPAALGERAIDVVPLPDGNALISFQHKIIKLKTDGTIDKTFAKNGVLENTNRPMLQGNRILAIRDMPNAAGYSVDTYDLSGKLVSAGKSTVNDLPRFLPDGRVYAFSNVEPRALLIFDSNMVPAKVGSYGQIELGNAVSNYLQTVGPFTDSTGAPTDGPPGVEYPSITTARDGGFIIDAYLSGKAAKLPAEQNAYGNYFTRVTIRISAAGKVVSINDGRARRTSVDFTNVGPEFKYGGKFLFGAGEDVVVKSPRTGDVFYGVARSGTAFYTAGVSLDDVGQSPSYFTIGRTVPIVNTITGVLFNDNNNNKKKDAGEAVNAGKTVYLDQNSNGKLDDGEISVVSDSQGKYTFADVGPGAYRVSRVLPSGYHLTNSASFTLPSGVTKVFDVGSTNTAATVKELVLA